MDDENPPPSRPYRIRRPSASMISSTTSPMFSAPATPNQLQPPPSPMAHHSRHRPVSQNNNFGPGDIDDDVQPSSSSSSFPPPSPRTRGHQASSSFSRSSQSASVQGPQSPLSSPDSTFWSGAAPSPSPITHSSSYRQPSTPGGMCVVSSSTVDDVPPSPFSPAEDSISNHGSSSGNNNNNVSNNTSNNNANNSASLNSVSNLLNNSILGPVAGPSGNGGASSVNTSGSSSSGSGSNNGSLLVHHRISQLIVQSGSSSSNNTGNNSNANHHSALISQLNQDTSNNHNNNLESNRQQQNVSTASSSSSSSSSFSFNASPLRNKIKKASSFERFSQAQAASNGAGSSRAAGSSASSAIVSNENSISSRQPTVSVADIINNSESSSNANNESSQQQQQPISLPMAAPPTSSGSSASSTIVSRISNWEPVAHTPQPSAPSTSSPSNSSTSSFRLSQTVHFGGDKSHIKIPSKKLAAKIASVFEQEQAISEAMAAATNVIMPASSSASVSASLNLTQQGLQQSSVVQSYLNSSASQSQSTSSSSISATNTNSTLSQILNEAPAHHLGGMGGLVSAAEEQIMSHHSHASQQHNGSGVSSHENLIRELSESPLNLTESSSSNTGNHHHHSSHSHNQQQHQIHSQQQPSILPQRNPVISSSSRASSSSTSTTTSASNISNNSGTSTLPSKKIPLTPKQKLLHRIQSGTISPPLEQPSQQHQQHSPHHQQQVLALQNQIQQQHSSPQQSVQQLSQQLQQASLTSALSNMQSPIHSLVQQAQSSEQQMQGGSTTSSSVQANSSHLILSTGGPHSPNSQLDPYSYDVLLRGAREDLSVQDALGKIIEDPGNVNNMPYDSPEAYAYYQSILNDDIFSGNSAASQQQASMSRTSTIQQQLSGSLQDPNDGLHQQSHHPSQIEFVLDLGNDDHDRGNNGNVGGRADDLSLGGDNESGQQQFLDPNDALAVIKSHNQNESTLRNLLLMDSRGGHVASSEEAWLLAEYQNRILSGDFSQRSSSTIRNGMITTVSSGNNLGSTSVLSINGLPTSIAPQSWNTDSSAWQRSTIQWQHQGGVAVDEDEVMDMSMIEPDKGTSSGANNGSIVVSKRISQLQAAYGDQGMEDVNLVSDRDLANGLPLLQNMSLSMPMDLQQPIGLLQSSGASQTNLKNALLSSQANGIPIDLQQHQKLLSASAGSGMDMDDQPVNLMAAANFEQELSHHSSSSGTTVSQHHHHSQQQHSAAHLLPHHLAEVKSLSHSNGPGNSGPDHSNQQTSGGSYALQIHHQQQAQHIPNEYQHHQQHNLVEVSNLSPVLDNIDERRIIRVKKNRESIPFGQESDVSIGNGLPPPNIIPDKPIQPKSQASLPTVLQLIKIGNGDDELAVFTRNKVIAPNTRFGPVEGSLVKACAEDMDTMNAIYPCLIVTDHHNNVLWKVNREDDDCCNWMKYVRMAHSIKDQNAFVSEGENDGHLYFTTCKEIPPRTELQVGFGFEYAQKYGLPYLLPLQSSQSSSSNAPSNSSSTILDDGKLTITTIQQQNQHSSAISTASTVIHGSQNFIHQQQQQMQKVIADDASIIVQNHHHSHHPPQSASVSPETTSAVLSTQTQQPTPQPPPQPSQQASIAQPQQKSVIVESYQCFECEQEFQDVPQLQEHLDKMHKEPEIRRPKKKAIKKYQQQQQQQQQQLQQLQQQISAVSTTNQTSGESMDVSFSFPAERSDPNKVSSQQQQQNQNGNVDSSSQSNCVDSSDILSLGNLPLTKKRKAASSMKASSMSLNEYNSASSSVIKNENVSHPLQEFSKVDSMVSSESQENKLIDSMSDEKAVLQNEIPMADAIGGSNKGNELEQQMQNNQQMQADGGNNDSDVTASQPPIKVKCTMCYKSFATKERLDRHMIVHSDEDTKPLKCPFCPKRFLTNSALAGHIKTHAEEGKCFECPICNFSTQQLLQLKEHVQTHKSRDSGMFHCPQCPKKFSAYSMIRKHIRAFHGPRQYECEQCPMSFPTSDKLKLHKLKHSDHREFLCAECGRQFKRKDKLREHTKRIHETKRKPIELTIPKDKCIKKFLPKISPEEFERFIYKCSECMVGFKRRGMLVNHLAKRHPEKPPQQVPELNMPIVRPTRNYFCLYCDRVYKSSSKRKAHIIKAHPGKPVPPQARSKDIPQQIASYIETSSEQPLQPGTIVQTLTDDGNNTARAGVVSSAVSSSRLGSGTVSSSALAAVVRRETVVGKVVAQPHGCQWCHRQYATRAKLLQHQRKAHINLMPPDMQMPRTQKNNVMRKESENTKYKYVAIKSEQESVISSNATSTKSDSSSNRTTKSSSSNNSSNNITTTSVVVTQSSSSSSSGSTSEELTASTSASHQICHSSTTSSSTSIAPVTTTATLQALQAEGLPFSTEEGGLVGILVTPVGSNVELGNLVQGDVPIVMLATQAVTGNNSAPALTTLQGVNFSVLQAGQVSNLPGGSSTNNHSNNSNDNSNGTNASPNIISISSSSSINNTTASTVNLESSGIITLSTTGTNSPTVSRIANVIQHHQSNSSNNNDNAVSSNTTSSSGSGVISTTGKI